MLMLTYFGQALPPDPYLEFFSKSLDIITIVIGIGAAIVAVMSFLGYRSINSLRDKLESDIRDLRAELRADTQRLQDQVESRISKIDSLIEKFDRESTTKLQELEQKGGTIREIAATAEKLKAGVGDASAKATKLIEDLEAKFNTRVEAVITKITEGKAIAAEEKEILATREAEIVKKEATERTGSEWFSLGVSYLSNTRYEDACRYIEIALEKGLDEKLRWTAYDNLGMCYRFLGQYEKALESFDKAYSLAYQSRHIPHLVGSLNSKSKMYALLGSYDEAFRLNSEAISYLQLPDAYHLPQVLFYNRALIAKLRGTRQDEKEYSAAIERLRGYRLPRPLLELLARDAAEFDLKSHPELGDLFEFCKSLPRDETEARDFLKEFFVAARSKAARAKR